MRLNQRSARRYISALENANPLSLSPLFPCCHTTPAIEAKVIRMSFCKCCSGIFQCHIFRRATRLCHHKSIANFVEAADQGCLICQRAFQNLTPESQGILRYYGGTLGTSTDAALPSFTEMEISVMEVVDSFKNWSIPPGIDLSIHLNAKHRVELQDRGIIDDDANISLRVIEKLQRLIIGILRITLYRSSGKFLLSGARSR